MTATKLSTSTGGHLCVEGELNGLRVQVIDQGARGGAGSASSDSSSNRTKKDG